jgi:hypothetical protein
MYQGPYSLERRSHFSLCPRLDLSPILIQITTSFILNTPPLAGRDLSQQSHSRFNMSGPGPGTPPSSQPADNGPGAPATPPNIPNAIITAGAGAKQDVHE